MVKFTTSRGQGISSIGRPNWRHSEYHRIFNLIGLKRRKGYKRAREGVPVAWLGLRKAS